MRDGQERRMGVEVNGYHAVDTGELGVRIVRRGYDSIISKCLVVWGMTVVDQYTHEETTVISRADDGYSYILGGDQWWYRLKPEEYASSYQPQVQAERAATQILFEG